MIRIGLRKVWMMVMKIIETKADNCPGFDVIATKSIKAGDEVLLDYKLTTN